MGFRRVLFLLLAAGSLPFAAAQEPPPDPYRYRVSVERVLVPVSVSTIDGRPVTTLAQDDFEVFEDNQARPIKLFEKETALALQLALMVDASLSTATELEKEKASMARFIRRVLRPGDSAALYEFSGGVRTAVDFTGEAAALERGLVKMKVMAGTSLYDAIVEVSTKLNQRPGRRVLVLVTDGNDTSSKNDFQAALGAAQQAEASIFALAIRPIPGESGRSVRGEHALITLADLTGGRVYFPGRAEEMDRFFDELSAFLRTQYLLGYQPAPPGPRAEFRTIEVRVKGGDYVVYHRKGYFTEARP